ncbi:MAG: amidohydrolase [Gammaproteobacteria bacterium]|nr:amidohydrolase [Gammaproteobacteria bacterium]
MSALADPNAWRKHSPGSTAWSRSPHANTGNKFFIASADCHAQEPNDFLTTRMPDNYQERLPGIVLGSDGGKFQKTEGFRPIRLSDLKFEGEDLERAEAGKSPIERLAALDRDGVDCELIFPNKGLTVWATPDVEFSQAMCRAWNDWAWETYGPYNNRLSPVACIAPADISGSIAEIERAAKRGFRALSLPCKPVWGAHDHEHPNYNLPEFDPLWSAVVDVDLPITFHVSTGRDPRAARGNGGAIINYTVHSLAPTMEPLVNLCASGVIERFPALKFGSIEAGIGWIPWMLTAMDEAYHKHHMWVRPKLKNLPSDYFRSNGFASFGEDEPGLALMRQFELTNNFLWANDFPHHEGTWPHSAAAIERTMGALTDHERAQVLGLNAARIFKFEIPDRYA